MGGRGANQQDCQHTMLPVPASPIAIPAGNAASAAAAVTASAPLSPAICCVPAAGEPVQQASHSLTLFLLCCCRWYCCMFCAFAAAAGSSTSTTLQRFRQQRQHFFFAWRQQQMAVLWQPQAVSLLEPRQQLLQQEQVEFCRPSAPAAAATERAQQGAGAGVWQQQLWCWLLLQQAVWLPALWFASVRCYMEGGRIKHRWLHES